MFFPFVRRSSFAGAMTVPFVLLLAACTSQPKPPAEADALPPPPVAPRVMPVEAEPRALATQPASLFTLATQGPVAAMLSYADKMRSLNGADLGAEISRIGDPGDSPTTQMQLALLLSQTRVPADLARALGLLQRVASNPSPEAQPLQPLARALAARYLEQRRVEDDRDKQVQQLRDSQRRIDQLNDRIEALRAIERSFARPNMAPALPAAPPNGTKQSQ
jgi:enoyl-CoA hydratase/carnithine racemase